MTRALLISVLLLAGCSSGESSKPQHRVECTPGTEPARCELAQCLTVVPDLDNFAVQLVNNCSHPVVFQESEAGPTFAAPLDAVAMTPYWRLRQTETGKPLNTSFAILVDPIQPGSNDHAAEVGPGWSGPIELPGLNDVVVSCDGSRFAEYGEDQTLSLILVAPPTSLDDAVRQNQAEGCHASECSVPDSVRCDELPNRVIFKDVVTFNRFELCTPDHPHPPSYCRDAP